MKNTSPRVEDYMDNEFIEEAHEKLITNRNKSPVQELLVDAQKVIEIVKNKH